MTVTFNVTVTWNLQVVPMSLMILQEDDKITQKTSMGGNGQAATALSNRVIYEGVSMTENQVSDMPFWSDTRRKGWSIFFIALGTFVLTLPYSIFSIFFYPLLKFPTGFLFLAGDTLDIEEIYWQQADIPSLLGWIVYIGMAIAIIRNKTERTIRILYIILVLLLILNVAGCQIIGPDIMAGVE